jgi:tetratricopeptide (TPR) repeat protein
MAGPLSKAPPPSPTAELRAQRRTRRRLVCGTFFGLILLVGVWQVYEYIASAPPRAEEQVLAARTGRADIYRRKKDPQRALEELNKVIETKPTMEAYSTRALIYAELGRHEEAIADFTWVIDEFRDAPFAFFGRAKSKLALGDKAGALEDEKSATALERGPLH